MPSPHLITDDLDLGVRLRDVGTPEQQRVVVVVTTLKGRHRPEFDAEALAREVPEAEVLVVPDHLSYRGVARSLGDDLGVHSGAARVYPIRVPGVPYEAPVMSVVHRTADEILPHLVQATRSAVAKAARAAAPKARQATTVVPAPTPETFAVSQQDDSSGIFRVDTPTLARALAQHLLEPSRTRPLLLVTRRAGSAAPDVDLARIQEETSGLVDIAEMATGEVSWAFAQALSDFPGTECYGGAARVYPVGLEWTTNLARSPLRFTWTHQESEATTEKLIRDVLAAAQEHGYRATAEASVTAGGRVEGIVSGRILVRLDGGGVATIWPELTAARIDAEHLATAGMTVRGVLDQQTGRLDVTDQVVPAAQALADYRAGELVLARVVAVERELAVVELYPEVQAALPAEEITTGRFVADVRQWLTEGECVLARVIRPSEDADDWELSLLDMDPDDAPLPAPALLVGGPPWLTRSVPDEDWPDEPEPAALLVGVMAEPVIAPATPAPVEATPSVPAAEPADSPQRGRANDLEDRLQVMTIERDNLRRHLAREQDLSGRLEDQLKALRTRARDLEGKAARAAKRLASAESALAAFADARADRELDRAAFLDPEEQFRFEVRLEWARRIPAAEKDALPMGHYRLGTDFLTTLAALDDRDRAKAVEVVVDVVTGRVHQLAARRTRQLRSGPGPNDPPVTRKDGAVCWRVSLQEKTPQARRLHYWQLSDGGCELSSVRAHDDVQP